MKLKLSLWKDIDWYAVKAWLFVAIILLLMVWFGGDELKSDPI